MLIIRTNWWVVYFWNCPTDETEAAFYMLLNKGFCIDPDQGESNNYDECTSWEDVKDMSDDQSVINSAEDYMTAYSSGITALAFAVASIVLTIAQFATTIRQWVASRVLNGLCLGVVTILLITTIAVGSDTYFTDQENYAFYYNTCDSSASFAYSGYTGAAIGLILSMLILLLLFFPCCCCVEHVVESPAQTPFLDQQQSAISTDPVFVISQPFSSRSADQLPSAEASLVTSSERSSGSTICYTVH